MHFDRPCSLEVSDTNQDDLRGEAAAGVANHWLLHEAVHLPADLQVRSSDAEINSRHESCAVLKEVSCWAHPPRLAQLCEMDGEGLRDQLMCALAQASRSGGAGGAI